MQNFSFAPSARRKIVDFLYGAPKTSQLFKCRWFCPPLEKFLRAPMVRRQTWRGQPGSRMACPQTGGQLHLKAKVDAHSFYELLISKVNSR